MALRSALIARAVLWVSVHPGITVSWLEYQDGSTSKGTIRCAHTGAIL